MLGKLSDQLSFTERIINNTILPVHYADDFAEHHRTMVKAIVETNEEVLQQELQHSLTKVEEYMRRIVGAFLDAKGE